MKGLGLSVSESRVLVSVSSQTDWWTPRSRNQGSRSWYRSRTVRPRAQPCNCNYADASSKQWHG